MDAEVIVLDSDDEDNRNNASMNGGSALASIAIVNSKPLDLDALGIGSLRPDDGVLNNNQNTRHYYGMRPMEERQHGLMSANRIKSNTNVAYMQTVTPISSSNPRPPVRIGYEKTRPRQAQALEDTGINAVSLLGGGSTRPIQTRPSRAQNNSPSSRSSVRHVPDSRVQNYNFEVNGEKSSDSDRQLCPTLKFRCQYPNCRRVITGNVSFVCHLWAHIATWKEFDPKSSSYPAVGESATINTSHSRRNDVDMLSTCPSCTARFHTPYLMQVHYTRCHSRQPQAVNRATCAICERDVRSDVGAANALRTHLQAHEPNDAPYHCKRCRYRCTVRLHLFDHFVKEHKNTSTLMCPFCTFTQVVPSYLRKRPVIRVSDFVQHMICHESESRLGCDNCALSFTNLTDKQKHRREHSAVNPKWTLTYRDPETRSRQRSRLTCQEQKPVYQCKNCVNSSEGGIPKKCLTCVTHAYNESLYGKRRMATDMSVRRGIDSLQCSTRGMRFVCKCGMKTRNGNRMAQHFYYCNKNFEVIDTDDELAEPTEADQAEDRMEAKLFAVLFKKEPVMPAVEVDVEKKRKFAEPPLLVFETEVSSMSQKEDMKDAVVFYRCVC
ncbi:unnamed protein product [Heligmosomoides polygyrus]|uniref:C2H2-type domain-containing protein n=1 Tax=Heligmosomoides polygyrus TaxID=6339 RepID=A0A183G719_HELPZ|nr:unnamed protein product [Heligmosomoides polygyrus]